MPMTAFDDFYLHRYRFSIRLLDRATLPPYKGFALRGALGHALKRLACTIPGESCNRCPFALQCAYAYLFETTPAQSVPDWIKFSSYPRPYLLVPPLSPETSHARGDRLQFDILLIGRAASFLPHVVLAFADAGDRGLGSGRARFVVDRVDAFDASGRSEPVFRDGVIEGGGTSITLAQLSQAAIPPAGEVSLRFVTPLRLEIGGKLCRQEPSFAALADALLRRVGLLYHFHCRGEATGEQLTEPDISRVRQQDADLWWHEMERLSTRQQSKVPQGGLLGRITYKGMPSALLPLLRLGELIHIGKSTTHGLGKYHLEMTGSK
jgi:hypothetical protein